MRNCLILLLLVIFGTSAARGALAPSVQAGLDAFRTKFGVRWAVDTTPDGLFITSLTGAPAGGAPGGVTPDHAAILAIELASSARSLTGFDEVRFSPLPVFSSLGTIRQWTWPQTVAGQLVENAGIVIQYSDEGGPMDVILNVAVPGPIPPGQVRTAAKARELAAKLVRNDVACPPIPLALRLANLDASSLEVEAKLLRPDSYYLNDDRRLRRVHDILVRVVAVTPCGNVTVALREYAIDAAHGSEDPGKSIVRIRNRMAPAVQGVARGFDPNPINTLNLPKLPTELVFDVAKAPHVEQILDGLDASAGQSYALSGTYVAIRERVCPDSVPPPVQSAQGKPNFTIARGGEQFAAANAYYHVDSIARWVGETLKIPETVPRALHVDVRSGDVSSTPDAGYVGDSEPYLWFSLTSVRKIFVAEDGDAVAHEYAHAVLDHTTDGYFAQEPAETGKNEACAINEGFADYWALSTFSKQTADSGHMLDCLMEWANEGKCLRDYPSLSYKTFKPTALDHVNGMIWSGTLYEIFHLLENDRALADSIILRGHLLRAKKGDAPIMPRMADGIVLAAAGQPKATVDAICEIFRKHEFGDLPCCVQVGCREDWKK